jgi:hypothetical protein
MSCRCAYQARPSFAASKGASTRSAIIIANSVVFSPTNSAPAGGQAATPRRPHRTLLPHTARLPPHSPLSSLAPLLVLSALLYAGEEEVGGGGWWGYQCG